MLKASRTSAGVEGALQVVYVLLAKPRPDWKLAAVEGETSLGISILKLPRPSPKAIGGGAWLGNQSITPVLQKGS